MDPISKNTSFKKVFQIKNLKLCYFVIFFIIALNVQSLDNFPFEKKIWSYWHDDDFSKAPMLVRQCSESMQEAAEKAGFQYFRLSQTTVKQYISNFQEKIRKVRQKSKQGGYAYEADLIRFHLILQNGGVWMDITVALPQGFDWLVNIKSEKYKNMISNRFSQQPDIMLFYYQGYQNTQEYRKQNPNNKNQLVLYNEFPGFEDWVFAAKKNNSIIRQIVQTYARFTQLTFQQLTDIFHKQDIYMNNVEYYGSHLTMNMAMSYTLQKRQLKYDSQKSIFSSRKTVFEHDNLWTISGVLGPLIWTRGQEGGWKLIELDIKGYQQRQYIVNFFIKMSGWFNSRISAQLQLLKRIFNQNGGQTFEQFIDRNPSKQQCIDITFLVNSSVLYPALKSLPQIKNGTIPTLSIQQRQRWYRHCQKYKNQISFYEWIQSLLFPNANWIDIAFYKVHQNVNFNKINNQSFKQNFKDFLFERKGAIRYFFSFLLQFLLISLAQILLIFSLYKIWKKLSKISDGQIRKSYFPKVKSIILFSLVILSGTLSFYQYFVIDYFGQRDDLPSIIIVLTLVFCMQTFIEKNNNMNGQLRTYYNLINPFINFWTTYLTFCLTRKYKINLIYFSIIIGLFGHCLAKLLISLAKVRKFNNPILIAFQYLGQRNIFRKSSVLLTILMYLFPSFRYSTFNGQYLLTCLPIILSFLVILIYLMIFVECIKIKAKMEILNLLILGSLSWFLKDWIYEKTINTGNNFWKVTWYMNLVCVYCLIFQQIGSSLEKVVNAKIYEKMSSREFIKYLAINLVKIVIYFSGFIMEVFYGHFSLTRGSPNSVQMWQKQILYLTMNSILIGVYVLITTQHKKEQDTEKEKFVEIQVSETFSTGGKLDY